MSELSLKVDVFAGADIFVAMHQMKELADKNDILVCADMNGVHIMVKPNADLSNAEALYYQEQKKEGRHKIVCFHPPETPKRNYKSTHPIKGESNE